AVGNLPVQPGVAPFLEPKHVPLLVPVAGVAVVGLGLLLWRRHGQLLLPLAVAAAMFAYFATSVSGPCTPAGGHTLPLFKLMQWSFPFTATVFGVGLAAILARTRGSPAGFAAGALCGLLTSYSVATHLASAEASVTGIQGILASKTPLADLSKFRREIRR